MGNWLNRTVQDIVGSIGSESYQEHYVSRDDPGEDVAIIVSKGREAISVLREAMRMISSNDDSSLSTTIVTDDGRSWNVKPPGRHDVPNDDVSTYPDRDLDIVLSAISAMARTYRGSRDELSAIMSVQSSCADPEERAIRVLVVAMILCHQIGMTPEVIASIIAKNSTLSYYLKHIAGEIDKTR